MAEEIDVFADLLSGIRPAQQVGGPPEEEDVSTLLSPSMNELRSAKEKEENGQQVEVERSDTPIGDGLTPPQPPPTKAEVAAIVSDVLCDKLFESMGALTMALKTHLKQMDDRITKVDEKCEGIKQSLEELSEKHCQSSENITKALEGIVVSLRDAGVGLQRVLDKQDLVDAHVLLSKLSNEKAEVKQEVALTALPETTAVRSKDALDSGGPSEPNPPSPAPALPGQTPYVRPDTVPAQQQTQTETVPVSAPAPFPAQAPPPAPAPVPALHQTHPPEPAPGPVALPTATQVATHHPQAPAPVPAPQATAPPPAAPQPVAPGAPPAPAAPSPVQRLPVISQQPPQPQAGPPAPAPGPGQGGPPSVPPPATPPAQPHTPQMAHSQHMPPRNDYRQSSYGAQQPQVPAAPPQNQYQQGSVQQPPPHPHQPPYPQQGTMTSNTPPGPQPGMAPPPPNPHMPPPPQGPMHPAPPAAPHPPSYGAPPPRNQPQFGGGQMSMPPQQMQFSGQMGGGGPGMGYPQIDTSSQRSSIPAPPSPAPIYGAPPFMGKGPGPGNAGGGNNGRNMPQSLPVGQVIQDVVNMGFDRNSVTSVVNEMIDQNKTVDMNTIIDRLTAGKY